MPSAESVACRHTMRCAECTPSTEVKAEVSVSAEMLVTRIILSNSAVNPENTEVVSDHAVNSNIETVMPTARIWDALEAGNDAEAFRVHAKLNALLNHIRQNVEMIIHFEKRILQRRGLIESARCRSPQFRSDAVYDRLFDELYADLEPEFIR